MRRGLSFFSALTEMTTGLSHCTQDTNSFLSMSGTQPGGPACSCAPWCHESALAPPLLEAREGAPALTIAHHAPGHFPEHQPESPDVHSLVGVEAICLDRFVQHFGSHVALGAHTGVVPHIQLVCALGMHNCKA